MFLFQFGRSLFCKYKFFIREKKIGSEPVRLTLAVRPVGFNVIIQFSEALLMS